eukprot:GHVS01023622.1.p1 GENE.GHVS01023622.1~~GHVS01023622.1.p1  ORF type:complete len:113 (+),score=0.04 GHVS01023622.1:84-422(+)
MKVSRCGCLLPLGLLVVVEGIKDVPLSSGKIYYSSECPADWTKLRLGANLDEVKSFARDQRGILLNTLYAEAGESSLVSHVASYASSDLQVYRDDRATVIYFVCRLSVNVLI